MLERRDALRARDDGARRDSEGDLRCDEPPPFDLLVQDGIEYAERCPDEARPQQWSHDAGEEDGPAREHGQHDAVEQPDQDGDATALKVASVAASAPARSVRTHAARMLMAYQGLPWETTPYAIARPAMAMPPATPPRRPAE